MPRKPSDSPAEQAASADSGPGELEGLEFETAVEELEALVEQMEAGDMTLEASLIAYERGVKLARYCQGALRKAELKVNKLTEDNRLEPLDPDQFDDD